MCIILIPYLVPIIISFLEKEAFLIFFPIAVTAAAFFIKKYHFSCAALLNPGFVTST